MAFHLIPSDARQRDPRSCPVGLYLAYALGAGHLRRFASSRSRVPSARRMWVVPTLDWRAAGTFTRRYHDKPSCCSYRRFVIPHDSGQGVLGCLVVKVGGQSRAEMDLRPT